jgi:hypothetical protein
MVGMLVFLMVANAGPIEVAWAQAPVVKRTPAQKRDAERKAQAAFTAGRYQEAIPLLDGLYAEFKEPVYLRNLGRCYQRLKEPDRAITTFEEYLLRAPEISATERDEIRGFIRDMEQLKREMAPATPAAPPGPPGVYPTPPVTGPAPTIPPPPTTTTAPTTTPPPAGPPPTGTATQPGLMPGPETQPQTSPVISTDTGAPPPSTSNAGKWVGIVGLGVAALLGAGGGAMLASSWSEYDKAKNSGCLSSPCPTQADRIDSRALWSKILFAGAGVTALAGGTLLIISASSSPSTASTGMTLALKGSF